MKTDSHSFDEMLDYGICNVTYRLDKIERLLFELDYEVMDVTAQIFVSSPNHRHKNSKNLFPICLIGHF